MSPPPRSSASGSAGRTSSPRTSSSSRSSGPSRRSPASPSSSRLRSRAPTACSRRGARASFRAPSIPGWIRCASPGSGAARGDEIYETFDPIFGCRSHGWLNLQSLHLNLPFDGDREFDALHSAIRLLLPLLPGLAASSPYLEGRPTGRLDSRLAHYRTHCAAVTSFAGDVIPEPLTGRDDYEARVYEPIRRDLPRVDPRGILRAEWTNARGAIARFDRGAIEIRLIDLQECPRMDLAVAALVVGALRHLVAGGDPAAQRAVPGATLQGVLADTIRFAERTEVADPRYLEALGFDRRTSVAEIWRRLRRDAARTTAPRLAPFRAELDFLERHGVLARRLLRAAGATPDLDRLRDTYRHLAAALAAGVPFLP